MKFRSIVSLFVAASLAFPLGGASIAAATSSELLRIDSIHVEGKEVVVTVQVPPEIKRVILESRPRIGSGSWEPVSIQRLDGANTATRTAVFRVALSAQMELLRVRGDSGDVLPASFYQGPSSFGDPTAVSPGARTGVDAVVPAPEAGPNAAAPGDKSETRSVVESDIWKIDGDTLYFFNQYRGLQVIDISKPEAPVIRGTYNMPAAGEQMYLATPTRVVLLAHDFCGGWGATAESQIVLLEIKDGKPGLAGQMTVPGTLNESRMVGSALYIVSERYRPMLVTNPKGGTDEVWEWGSQISSFDLGNFTPSQPKFVEWVPGYGNAIQATDQFLFVATPQMGANQWAGASEVRIFDISSPDGTMQPLSTIPVAGRVKDKFKMHLNAGVFAVVTETWDNQWKTQVETFSMADPRNPKRLASLPIIDRERLFATRFAGSLLYAVTFFVVDPLWIIDLSDPAQPRKVGELEIPGWSTFIQPLGDRLVTVGIDNTQGWRTSVQLFDVQNPEKPTLLGKVLLGEGHSSSEANQDEKAFGVLPEANLILVPFSSWTDKGSVQAVQLIDLGRDGLKQRGTIDHDFPARRATLHRDRILSISGTELLGVDATNRDQPKVTSRTELSWAADRLFLQGDNLVTIAQQGKRPAIHISLASDHSKVLTRADLAELPFLGATIADQRLFVLQGKSSELIWPKIWNPTNYVPIGTNRASLKLSVFDLKQLPQVSKVAEFDRDYEDGQKYWSDFSALWPKPGLLIWSKTSSGLWWRGGPIFFEEDAARGAPTPNRIAASVMPIWWGGGYDASFLAFDVASETTPKLVSEVELRGTNNWWNFSQAIAHNGLVYLTHETSEYDPVIQLPSQTVEEWDGTKFVKVIRTPPPGSWVHRYFLDVIRYADPREPAVRKPVSVPGSLIGLARDGNLVYTQGSRYADPVTFTDWSERIDVSAYDGVEARLVDSMKLPQVWPRPVLIAKDHLFLGRAPDATVPAAIEVWTVSDSAKLARVSETPVKPASQNFAAVGGMLAAQTNNELSLYDMTNPASLRLIANGSPGGCLGFNLQYADGVMNRGVWVPLGLYGVTFIEVKP